MKLELDNMIYIVELDYGKTFTAVCTWQDGLTFEFTSKSGIVTKHKAQNITRVVPFRRVE